MPQGRHPVPVSRVRLFAPATAGETTREAMMANRKSDTAPADDPAAAMMFPFQETIAGMHAQMAQMMTGQSELARRWMEGWTSVLTELMDFSGKRLQQNFETLELTARCQDPQEALRLQMSGLETTIRLYADEAGRLYTLCSRTGADCLKAFDDTQPQARSEPGDSRKAAE
jgi:hypothetical protein